MNLRILLLETKKFSDFLRWGSKLFHSIVIDGKREFLKKLCFVLRKSCVLLIDLKKRKDFTPKKEDNNFSQRRKSKTINKELFPGKFVCFFVSLFKRRKDSALVDKFYNTAVCVGDHH